MSLDTILDDLRAQRAATFDQIERLHADLGRYDEAIAALEPLTDSASLTVSPIEEENDGGGHMCPDCRRTFTTGHGLQVHRRRTHNTGPTEPAPGRVPCEHCGEQITRTNLGRHIARHHADRPGAKVEHRCEECGQVFANGNGLGGHRRAHKPRKNDTAPAAALVEPPAWPSTPTIAPVADPTGKTDFDGDGARLAAADALYADNAGVTVKPAETGFTAPAKSKPTRFCSNGCGTPLSLYNDTGICSACEAKIRRDPFAGRNVG